jgi:hypothetical protein
MRRTDWRPLLDKAARLAIDWLDGVPERQVTPRMGPDAMLAALDRPLPDAGTAPAQVIDELARTV